LAVVHNECPLANPMPVFNFYAISAHTDTTNKLSKSQSTLPYKL